MEIFVSNLPHSAESGEIETLFASFGKVDKIKVLKDKFSGKPRGMAFVAMSEESDIKSAIESLNGFMMQGRAIKVEKARSRTFKSGGFNGFRPKTSFDFDAERNGKKRFFKNSPKSNGFFKDSQKKFPKDGKNFSKDRPSFSKRKFGE